MSSLALGLLCHGSVSTLGVLCALPPGSGMQYVFGVRCVAYTHL